MNFFSFKVPIIVLSGCIGIGFLLAQVADINWVSASLLVLLAVLVNGLVISIEDRPKPQEFQSQKDYLIITSEYQSMFKIQVLITLLTVFGLGASFAFFGN